MNFRTFALALTLFTALPCAEVALAHSKQYTLEDSVQVRNITVVMHNTDVLMFDEDIGSYAVGDPEIADVLPIRGKEAYLQGKKLGTTNLTVMSADGIRRAVFNIEVTLNVKGISKAIRQIEPSADISITTSNGRIIISGAVPDAPSAARIMEVVSKFVESPDDVVNAMVIADAQQVMLEVRFLEVNRSLGKELGVDMLIRSPDIIARTGTGLLNPIAVGSSSFAKVLASFSIGAVDVDMAIRALEAKGVTRRLAEPNLVALSGQEAKFLAGGEFPYSVPQAEGVTTTDFKRYGIELTFTPTVLRNDVINLKLLPKFSQLDFTTSKMLGGGEPGLLERSAETMVELRDGQTFVIAGLLDGLNERNVDQVPGLGNVPVLGTLFRSSSFRKKETELIIVVTPRLVKPMVPGTPMTTPLDAMKSSSDADLLLNGQLERKPEKARATAPSSGAVGHILDIGG